MQIQAQTADQAFKEISSYIDKGWNQVSLATSSVHANEIIGLINYSKSFDIVVKSYSVAINALNLTDSGEFVISIIFDPTSSDAIKQTKSFLKELYSYNKFYGKKLISKATNYVSYVDNDLQAIIDSFWSTKYSRNKTKNTIREIIKRFFLITILFVIIFFVTFNISLRSPQIISMISNHTFLEYVYRKSKNPKVQLEAVKNIIDEQTLFEIVMNDKNRTRINVAAKKISNRQLLSKICIEKYDLELVEDIMQNIKDQDFITNIAKNGKHNKIRTFAVGKITDEELLTEFALNDKSDDVRKFAVLFLSNQTTLIKIANNDKDSDVRINAINKIKDIDYLTNLLLDYNEKISIRLAALANISDQKILIKVSVMDHENYNKMKTIIKKIIERIKNQDDLIYIARNANNYQVRISAVQKIDNQKVLFSIAKNDVNKVSYAAAVKLEDEKDKAAIIIKTGTFSAINQITSEEVLLEIINKVQNIRVTDRAIKKINNKEILNNIAKTHSWYKVRILAIKRIENQETLVYLGLYDEDHRVQSAALARVNDIDVLNSVVENTKSYSVRSIAKRRIELLSGKFENWVNN